MKTDETDKMLKIIFQEQKSEIADNGFTNRVISHLPETNSREWIVWLFAALGLSITLFWCLTSGCLQSAMITLHQVPLYYFLIGICAFPMLGAAVYYYANSSKNYRFV
jgi:hypothetical protein